MQEPAHKFERSFKVTGGDYATAGEAASKIKKILIQLGINSEIVRKIAIATYEAELNIIIHAYEGEIIINIDNTMVEVSAVDRGPGIPDIDLAMQEGYSTASMQARQMGFGAGMGLPNMKRCSNQFKISSEINIGTTVKMGFLI